MNLDDHIVAIAPYGGPVGAYFVYVQCTCIKGAPQFFAVFLALQHCTRY